MERCRAQTFRAGERLGDVSATAHSHDRGVRFRLAGAVAKLRANFSRVANQLNGRRRRKSAARHVRSHGRRSRVGGSSSEVKIDGGLELNSYSWLRQLTRSK